MITKIKKGDYRNLDQLGEFERYRDNFANKLGNDYNQFTEETKDAEIMEAIELSKILLVKIANSIIVNNLTHEQVSQLQSAAEDTLKNVMNSEFAVNTLKSVQTGFAQFITDVPWLNSIIHILNLLAPLASTFGYIAIYANPIGFFLLVINLCIVALHYTVRLSIFFWRKYANKTDFKPEEFLNELKLRTSVQKGGKTVRFVTAKSKTRTLKGGVLPAIHPRSSIQQVHNSAQTSLPSIQGVKLPVLQRQVYNSAQSSLPPIKGVKSPGVIQNQDLPNQDFEILSQIANTIVYDISKYSNATKDKYKLIPSDINDMASALQKLITSDTVDINDVYRDSKSGGKPKRTIRSKHTLLQSKTKKELLEHAKSKGITVKSTYKKDDIIKAISLKRYKK